MKTGMIFQDGYSFLHVYSQPILVSVFGGVRLHLTEGIRVRDMVGKPGDSIETTS